MTPKEHSPEHSVEELNFPLETLRCEYYRLVSWERAVSEELIAAGAYPDIQESRAKRKQIIEAVLILGGDMTTDMRIFRSGK